MKQLTLLIATALSLPLAPHAAAGEPAPLPQAELQQLLAVYALVKAQYVDQVDGKKIMTDAIGGMLASLDPHSQYLNKEDLVELDKTSSGQYVGIGIDVEVERGKMLVLAVSDDSPSARAGVRAGDTIIAIDGKGVTGLSMGEITRRMRGEPGSEVRIAYARPGEGTLREATLTRASMSSTTVKTRALEQGLLWIRISEFGAGTARELADALGKADTGTPPKGVILDLRNDPGGLIAPAVGVAAAFLAPDAVVFSARGRLPGVNATVTASPRYYMMSAAEEAGIDTPAWARTVPMAVLINGGSVSAAELLAGALQDHRRGTLVGARTFGKGSIQTVMPLTDDSGVKMTVARYYTPDGHEIQARGITPDVIVQPGAIAAASRSVLLREADLGHHLRGKEEVEGAPVPMERGVVEDSAIFGTPDDKAMAAAIGLLAPTGGRAPSMAHSLAQTLRAWPAALRKVLR